MGYSADALTLRKPKVIELPLLRDRISFLYLDFARVIQERTGVVAVQEGNGGEVALRLPVASIGFLLLGPGTSISAQAMISLHRAGTAVIFTSSQGVTSFALARPLTGRADWAQAQARCWASEESRLAAARVLYEIKLEGLDLEPGTSLKVMRGIEGAYTRRLYQRLAGEQKLVRWRRETDPEKYDDPVNPLLNLGSAILYGAATTAVSALDLSPSLGFIHNGAVSALLFDLADLYKTKSSIPIAFKVSRHPDPAASLRREMRQFLVQHNVLDSMLQTLSVVLSPHLGPAELRRDTLTSDSGVVAGHTNYSVDSGEGILPPHEGLGS